MHYAKYILKRSIKKQWVFNKTQILIFSLYVTTGLLDLIFDELSIDLFTKI